MKQRVRRTILVTTLLLLWAGMVKAAPVLMCVYGGKPKASELNKKSDYLMWADTKRWEEMGIGKYGPMRAMMLFRLKFQGPKWEAMRHIGPFKNLLLLAGKVPGHTASCL